MANFFKQFTQQVKQNSKQTLTQEELQKLSTGGCGNAGTTCEKPKSTKNNGKPMAGKYYAQIERQTGKTKKQHMMQRLNEQAKSCDY